jgi:hypothetical protein
MHPLASTLATSSPDALDGAPAEQIASVPPRDELATSVGRRWGETCHAVAVEIEQVRKQPLELACVRCDPFEQVQGILAWDLHAGLFEGERRAEDRCERRP